MTLQNKIKLAAGVLVLTAIFTLFNWMRIEYLAFFPIGLLFIYLATYQTEKFFLFIAFLTPFSVNIEEYIDGFGLYLPTEPLLFGFMLWFLFLQLKAPFLDYKIWKSPIIISVSSYLVWLFITSITSTEPIVSFKFLLSKLWFIVPILIFGTYFFKSHENRIKFLWYFIVSCSLVLFYDRPPLHVWLWGGRGSLGDVAVF